MKVQARYDQGSEFLRFDLTLAELYKELAFF